VSLVVLLDSVADEQGGIPWRLWRKRRKDWSLQVSSFARQWSQRDWPGALSLLGDSIKRRLSPEEMTQAPARQEPWTIDWTRGVPQAYLRSSLRYRLKPYSGRVTLIFTKDNKWELNPELPWRKTASNLDVHWVSGDHTTALAAHIAETAGAIRAALARVEA